MHVKNTDVSGHLAKTDTPKSGDVKSPMQKIFSYTPTGEMEY